MCIFDHSLFDNNLLTKVGPGDVTILTITFLRCDNILASYVFSCNLSSGDCYYFYLCTLYIMTRSQGDASSHSVRFVCDPHGA